MWRRLSIMFMALMSAHFLIEQAIAQDRLCDCTKFVGACNATFQLKNIRADAQGRNSSAELLLRSTSPSCSRIDYYVDNTPYFSVLGNTNEAQEHIYGTSRISTQTVTVERCRVCARATVGAGTPQSPTPPPGNGDLSGNWVGRFTGKNADTMSVSLQITNDRPSGQMILGGKSFDISGGAVNGNQITMIESFVMGNVTWVGNISPDRRSIRGQWTHTFGGGDFELTKQ